MPRPFWPPLITQADGVADPSGASIGTRPISVPSTLNTSVNEPAGTPLSTNAPSAPTSAVIVVPSTVTVTFWAFAFAGWLPEEATTAEHVCVAAAGGRRRRLW
jgi:hypothetical protein